jgi:hypothetical protein
MGFRDPLVVCREEREARGKAAAPPPTKVVTGREASYTNWRVFVAYFDKS